MFMPFWNKTFRLNHKRTMTVDIPRQLIIDNILDFEHVNFVHKKCFAYSRVVAKTEHTTLLEYGVRHIPGWPLVTHYVMYHQYFPPDRIVHYSKPLRGRHWTKSVMYLKDISDESGPKTYYESTHEGLFPIFLKPFTKWMLKLADYWADIVWKEDSALLRRRQKILASGFKDGPLCGKWVFEDGTSHFKFIGSAD